MGNDRDHSPLQSAQVDGETFPQLFEESYVQRDPTERIKHTEYLTRNCAGGEVSIACEQEKSYHTFYPSSFDIKILWRPPGLNPRTPGIER